MGYFKEMFCVLTYYCSTYDSKSKSNTKTGCLEASLCSRSPFSIFPFKIKGVYQPVEKKEFVSATVTLFLKKNTQLIFSDIADLGALTIWVKRGKSELN